MNKSLENLKDIFMNSVGRGIENAKFAKEFPITKREVRLAVNALKKEGEPICSGQEGYWLAKKESDLNPTIATLNAQREDLENILAALTETQILCSHSRCEKYKKERKRLDKANEKIRSKKLEEFESWDVYKAGERRKRTIYWR